MQSSLTDFFASPRASSIRCDTFNSGKSKSIPKKRSRSNGSNSASKRPRLQQMIIDAGQKKFGLEHCVKCGMVYSLGDPKDQEQHVQFHNRFTETKNFRVSMNQIEAWKKVLYNEDVMEPIAGCLFLVSSTTNSTLKRKFETVLTNFVNEELGYSAELPVWDQKEQRKVLLFVAYSNGSDAPPFIAGILLVDAVDEVILMPQQRHFKGNFLGVDRIWVHSRVRRKGIATFILDAARRIVVTAGNKKEVSRTRVAFSDPSDLGIKLAIDYVGDKENVRYIIYSPPEGHTNKDGVGILAKKLGV